MAVRDLTARIRFTADTTQLSGAFSGLSTGAKKAGDAVKKTGDAVDKAGDEAKKAGDKAKKAGDAVKKAGDEIKKAGDKSKKAGDAVKKTGDALKKTGDEAKKTGDRFKKFGIGALASMVALRTAMVASRKALELFRESTVRAGQERGLEVQLRRDGVELEKFVTLLDDAAKGALSRADAVQAAARAIALGVDIEAIPKLLDVARKSAIVTGQTVTQAFDDITLGTARQSRLILDNLGIIISVEKANQKYAETLGVASSALTDTQRRQAFLNEVIAKGTTSFGDLAEAASRSGIAFDALKANVTDASDSFVDNIAQAGSLADTIDRLNAAWFDDIEALKSVVEQEKALNAVIEESNQRVDESRQAAVKMAEANLEAAIQAKALSEQQAELAIQAKAAAIRLGEINVEFEKLVVSGVNSAEAMGLAIEAVDALAKAAKAATGEGARLRAEQKKMADEAVNLGTISRNLATTLGITLFEATVKAAGILNDAAKATKRAEAANTEYEASLQTLGVATDESLRKEIDRLEVIKASSEAQLAASEISEGQYLRTILKADEAIQKATDTLNAGYLPAIKAKEQAEKDAAEAAEEHADGQEKVAQTTNAAVIAINAEVAALISLNEANRRIVESGGIIGGQTQLGGTRVSFGTVRDAEGNIIQSAGSRLVRSDVNGNQVFRTGGNFTTIIGGGIVETQFGGLGTN